jgi:flavin-dependent dehydrogenase
VTVHEGVGVQDVLRDAAGAVAGVRTRDPDAGMREWRARCVVGADGLGSVVARRAGLHRQGRLRRVAFVAHVAGVHDLTLTTELHVARDGYVGVNALGGGIANVAVVVPAACARGAGATPRASSPSGSPQRPACATGSICARSCARCW